MGEHTMYRSCHRAERVRIKHRLELLPLIWATIRLHRPAIFVELGTLQGGFTLALHEEFGDKLKIITFDRWLKGRNLVGHMCRGVTFVKADLLSGESDKLIEVLALPARKVLYCDNGNKIIEINTYAKYLNAGDLLGTHDWLVRPPMHKRPLAYQARRRAAGTPNDDAVTDPVQIADTISRYGFEPYDWDRYEAPGHEENGCAVTDDRFCSRFWVRRGDG